jgi:hypothetical protein
LRRFRARMPLPVVTAFGAPLEGKGDVTGFSILPGDARASLHDLLADHPHRHLPGAKIDVLELMALPGTEG